jgi:acyl-ACP thioesterase
MELLWRVPRVVGAPADVPHLCRLFEDAARGHATHLGVGVEHLHAMGRAWVLSRFSLRIHRMPKTGDEVEVITWPSRRTAGIRAWRDFQLVSGSGELLAEATSIWPILDIATRRLTRLPPLFSQLEFPDRDSQIAPVAQAVPSRPPDSLSHYAVGASDIDENNHANNVSYVAWAWPALCAALEEAWQLEELHVEYAGEAFLDDLVIISAWDESAGRARRVQQRMETAGRLLTRILSVWRAVTPEQK